MWCHIKQILQAIVLATAMLVSCSHVMVFGKATKCFITFYLVYTTLPNYNQRTRISAHTLGWNFNSFHGANPQVFFFFFPLPSYSAVQQETKRCYQILCKCVRNMACKPSIVIIENHIFRLQNLWTTERLPWEVTLHWPTCMSRAANLLWVVALRWQSHWVVTLPPHSRHWYTSVDDVLLSGSMKKKFVLS